MPVAYREQITKTFRNDAIRSVLLIDDEYNPYIELSTKQQTLINALQKIVPTLDEGVQPPKAPEDAETAKHVLSEMYEQLNSLRKSSDDISSSFKRTSVAAEFVRFFHNEKYICDVEKQVSHLNPDKVRKSDLIILDYCLSHNDSTKSLQLLRELSTSRHLNLVVIYTNKPLEDVWLEIATTLRCSKILAPQDYFESDETSLEQWDNAESVYSGNWTSISRKQQVKLILGDKNSVVQEVKARFWQDIQEDGNFDNDVHKEPTEAILRYLVEKDIKGKQLNEGADVLQVHGEDKLWIQCGEVFIALCEKKDSSQEEIEQQPQAVWDKLEEALHNWYPNFYRVVLSELQNRIEDSNFSMSKILGKPEDEQVSLLWSILKEHPDKQLNISENILHHLLLDISDELVYRDDKAGSEFIKKVANSIAEDIPEFVKFQKSAPQPHNDFLKEAVRVSKGNFKDFKVEFDAELCLNIAHAHNRLLSTQRVLPDNITTGTVLKSCEGKKTIWYVCVTPSCDTVPEQEMDDCARWLSPHRLLSFIRLNKDELVTALQVATQSSHIFVSDNGDKVALRVINQYTKQPDLLQLIVKDHKTIPLTLEGKTATSITSIKKKKNKGKLIETDLLLLPVGQLKPAYAARFQAIMSHHEGRIGVDYSPADFSVPVLINPAIDLTD
ncbi:hypothetical protein FM037_03115 [Shewanella psychropiezotolerans]|uniref:Response receiver domain-containing protein n=1 Tax=Shewanella psychropiezotolerans TaxID=2593655 RepID=A0ABX5WTK0_9GAMM|nr:response regulator receiver domain [Shewanella psychropiezotolerans]QDO82418.1 hypothetical protein FM037_03115 [Shewanella psychropiezotolerans]